MRPHHLLLLLFLSSSLLHHADSHFIPTTRHRRHGGGHHLPGGHHHHRLVPADAPLRDICARTDYPDTCLSSARPYAPAFRRIDPAAVLNMLIRAATARTRAASNAAGRIALDPRTTPAVAVNMRSCQGSYGDALDGLSSAAVALAARDEGTASSMLSGCITSYGDCESGFAETPVSSPLAGDDELLRQMASNCLAILKVVFPSPF